MSKIQEEAQKRLEELQERAKDLQDKVQESAKELQDRVEERVKDVRDRGDKAGEFAKNVWLAGLGAYGKAYDEATTAKEKTADLKTPKLFEDLVAKGEKIESQTRARLEEMRDNQVSIEERISKMRSALGFGHTASSEDMSRLEDKVDALSKKVDSLTKPAASKAPAKKAPAKKEAAAKAPAKKAPAKKAPAKKKAAAKK